MRWRDGLEAIRRTVHLMVGVPDYAAYAARREAAHPGEPVMTARQFHGERIARRFGGGADRIGRCC